MPGYGALWANRPFRALWIGTLAIRLGSQIGIIALTWLVLRTTGSGTKIGIVLALYAVGDMVASPLAGVLLDRWSRKRLLNANVLFQGLIFVILAILFWTHRLPFVLLLVIVWGAGALSPVSYLGRMIILPNVVRENMWETANTAMQFNMNMVTLLGPALGGILVGMAGIFMTLMVTALTCFVYVFCLMSIPTPLFQSAHPHQPLSFVLDVLVGWRFLRTVPLLLTMVLVTFFFSLTYGPLEPALPILVQTVFHRGPETLGILWSGFAVGALAGTLLWGRLRPIWPLRPVVSVIIVFWGGFSGLVGLTHWVWAAILLLALGGLTYAPYNILYSLWRQRLVPDSLRGKVFGVINSVTGAGLPLGQALGGILIGALGASATVEIGGVACVMLGIGVFLRKSLWNMPSVEKEFPCGASSES